MIARDRAAASAGRGPLARWTGWRLFAAAERGNTAARKDVARIAAMPEHRSCERAREAVAVWWARDRDPFLRQAVLDTRAIAPEAPGRLMTLALLGRLAAEWEPEDAQWAPALLADDDPEVRERTAAVCREASGAALRELWNVATVPGTALRDVLLANDEPPSPIVLDALWGEWMERPSEPLWNALARWGRPATGGKHEPFSVIALKPSPAVLAVPRYRKALITALTLGDHPLCGIAEQKVIGLTDPDLTEEICAQAMERPELVYFCKKHRIAPKDQVKRATFFLLTGQPEQHRAMDPDGALLSLAYASASNAERRRIQEFMLGAGELDLVRVIVGDDRRSRIPAMSHEELRYLGEQLAARREWDDLWAVVQDVPITSGIELIRLFDGWVPRDDDSRRLFEMYLETGASRVPARIDVLPRPLPPMSRQARFLFHGRVNDVSFAPDGPYLAVAGTNRVAGVFDLRTAELVERYGGFKASVGRVLHTGNGALIAGERTNRVDRECRVVRCVDGDTQTLHKTPGSITSLAADGSGGFVAATRAGNLLLSGPGGEPVTSVPVRSLGMGSRWPRAVAVHPASGLLAVLGRGLVVTDLTTLKPVADVPASAGFHKSQAAFVDADSLLCAEPTGALFLAKRHGENFSMRVSSYFPRIVGLAASPGLGEPVILDGYGDLHILDAETLTETSSYRTGEPQRPTGLTVSPSGEFLAVSDAAGHTDLFDLRIREVPQIIQRPVVELVPRHLGILGAALADTATTWTSRNGGPMLRLLHACLEHRFRFDIEIGDAVRLTAGEHDISL